MSDSDQARSGENLRTALFRDHFEKVEQEQAPGKFDAVCRHCGHKYKLTNNHGYGNLKLHITKKHPEKIKNDGASGSGGN